MTYSSLPVAWGDSQPHRSWFNLSHHRHSCMWPELCIVSCFSMPPFLSALHDKNWHSSIRSSTSIMNASILFLTLYIPHLLPMLTMDGLLCWRDAPWPGFAPLNYIPRSSITIITLLAHAALHFRHSSFAGGAPLFPLNSSYCLSNSILIHQELTSQFQLFWYHKSSQTTLEFDFTHSPDRNHFEIEEAPSPMLRYWRIVSSCIPRPWRDARLSVWHWYYVWLISFDCSVGLLH